MVLLKRHANKQEIKKVFNTITVQLGRAAVLGTLQVDTERFSALVQRHIYEYGLRQILNDAMAEKRDEDGKPLPQDQIVAKAKKRLANLYSGELRAKSEVFSDPIERIVFAQLRDMLLTKWRADGKLSFPKGTKNRFLFVANAIQVEAGRKVFEDDESYLRAVLAAAPKTEKKLRKLAEERLQPEDELAGLV